LYNGAHINCVDRYGEYPLHNACHNGDEALELVKFLVSHGADVNCVDRKDRSPIQFASKNGAYKLLKFLRDNGANE
jgi:ankyrin repeat protein